MFCFSTKEPEERLSHKAKIILSSLYMMSVHRPGEVQQQMMLDTVQPYSKTVSAQITVCRNSTKDMGGKQRSTGMIGAMAAHCLPSIFFYGEGKNNARLASQKTKVERRWDTIRVSERREKVIRNKVACRVLELHSASSEVMRF